MMEDLILAIIIGTLAAIVYSLRILVLMNRKIERIEGHLETLVAKVLTTEKTILKEENEELKILRKKQRPSKTKKSKNKTKKKKKSKKR